MLNYKFRKFEAILVVVVLATAFFIVFQLNQIQRNNTVAVAGEKVVGDIQQNETQDESKNNVEQEKTNKDVLVEKVKDKKLEAEDDLCKNFAGFFEMVSQPIIKDIDEDGKIEKIFRCNLLMADRIIQNLYIYRKINSNYKLVKVFEGDPYGFAKMIGDEIIVGHFVIPAQQDEFRAWDDFSQFEILKFKWIKNGSVQNISRQVVNATSAEDLSKEIQNYFE